MLSHVWLCDPMDRGAWWASLGKNTGVGSHPLLLGIFLTQESNPCLLHCRRILYHLSHQGSPLKWLANFPLGIFQFHSTWDNWNCLEWPGTPSSRLPAFRGYISTQDTLLTFAFWHERMAGRSLDGLLSKWTRWMGPSSLGALYVARQHCSSRELPLQPANDSNIMKDFSKDRHFQLAKLL